MAEPAQDAAHAVGHIQPGSRLSGFATLECSAQYESGEYRLIPLQDLIGWRAHAPWPNDEQVEQDYLLSKSVAGSEWQKRSSDRM